MTDADGGAVRPPGRQAAARLGFEVGKAAGFSTRRPGLNGQIARPKIFVEVANIRHGDAVIMDQRAVAFSIKADDERWLFIGSTLPIWQRSTDMSFVGRQTDGSSLN